MFPFVVNGVVTLPVRGNNEPGRALDRIVTGLRKYAARNVVRNGDTLTFRAGMFRSVPNWNPLVAITHGRLTASQVLEGVAIRYRLWFTEMLIWAIVGGIVSGWFVGLIVGVPCIFMPVMVAVLGLVGLFKEPARFRRLIRRVGLGLEE